MAKMTESTKAVVHVSGTLLRRSWYSSDLYSAIVVRPAGQERDEVGYVVNQVRFRGPSEMVFDAKPREKAAVGALGASESGYVGRLPGFDGAVMIYVEADEDDIEVQVERDGDYIPFADMVTAAASRKLKVMTIDPRLADGC